MVQPGKRVTAASGLTTSFGLHTDFALHLMAEKSVDSGLASRLESSVCSVPSVPNRVPFRLRFLRRNLLGLCILILTHSRVSSCDRAVSEYS